MEVDFKCRICGMEFASIKGLGLHIRQIHAMLSKEYYDKFYRQSGEGICEICGKPTKFYRMSQGGYFRFCSKKCAACSESTKKRKLETNINLYGGTGFASKELNDKARETCIEKYGTEYVSSLPEFKETVRRHAIEKYGKESVNGCRWKIEKSKKKYAETMARRYGSLYMGQYPEIVHYKGDTLECHCPDCDKDYIISKQTFLRRKADGVRTCLLCNPIVKQVSNAERELCDFIKMTYGGQVVENDRSVLSGSELDIYLPSEKLAFEYDGLYWHSEANRANDYHLKKTESCEAVGIRLVHVFEDEWEYKRDIVKSRISGLLGKNKRVFARKCTVIEVSYAESIDFLASSHIQGPCSSAYRYGLYFDGKLVALMTFGASRFARGEYELLRYCSALGVNVVGGASRLFAHFLKGHPEIGKIVSFADRRWSTGGLYQKLGFTLAGKTRPAYYYVIGDIRHNRLEFQKHKLVKAGFNQKLTEHEIMLSRGIYRIYDCGNLKYEYTQL